MFRQESSWLVAVAFVAVAASASVGCNDNSKKGTVSAASSSSAESAAERSGLVDPNLGKALEATKRSAKKQTTNNEEGPPKNGLLSSEKAGKVLAKQARPLVKLGSAGDKPSWQVTVPVAMPKRLGVTVSTMLGPRRGLPTLDLNFKIKSADKGKRTQGKNKDAGSVEPSHWWLELSKTSLGAQQPGQIPEQFKAEIKKMNGAKVNLALAPSGGLYAVDLQQSKKAKPELGEVLVAAVEGMMTFQPAWPKEKLGVGATWLVTSREQFQGLDVVSYRMYTLKQMGEDSAQLTCQIRQYAASTSLSSLGMPEGTTVVAYQSNGSSSIVWSKKNHSPLKGKLQLNTQYALQMPNQPQQRRANLVFLSTVTFSADNGSK